MPLPGPAEIFLPAERARHQITSLAIIEEAVTVLAKLPMLHRDPFDRIIIAQAIRSTDTGNRRSVSQTVSD